MGSTACAAPTPRVRARAVLRKALEVLRVTAGGGSKLLIETRDVLDDLRGFS